MEGQAIRDGPHSDFMPVVCGWQAMLSQDGILKAFPDGIGHLVAGGEPGHAAGGACAAIQHGLRT